MRQKERRTPQPDHWAHCSKIQGYNFENFLFIKRRRITKKVLQHLETGMAYAFGDWPNRLVPKVAIGVYTVWEKDRLLYGGMAGDKLTKNKVLELRRQSQKEEKGLYKRLASHANGRRGDDQFCIYVCDRLILATLTRTEIDQIASGELKLDDLTREYIHKNLTYRFVEVEDVRIARNLEKAVKRGELSVGKPLFNLS